MTADYVNVLCMCGFAFFLQTKIIVTGPTFGRIELDAHVVGKYDANLRQTPNRDRQLSALARGGFSVCGPRTEVRSSRSGADACTGRALALGGAARSSHHNIASPFADGKKRVEILGFEPKT